MEHPYQLSLASATLENGARIASSGFGCPARITTAADVFPATAYAVSANTYTLFNTDATAAWMVNQSPTPRTIRKITLATNSVATTLSVTSGTPGGGCRDVANGKIYFGGTTTAAPKLYTVDLSNDTLSAEVALTGGAASTAYYNLAKCDGVAKIWGRPSGAGSTGNIVEFDIATGAATGRTIAGSANGTRMIAAYGSYIYQLVGGSSATVIVKRFAETDPTTAINWITVAGGGEGTPSSSRPGSGQYHQMAFDSGGKLYLRCALTGNIDRWNTDGTFDKRFFWGNAEELGLSGRSNVSSGNPDNYNIGDFSNDGNYLLLRCPDPNDTALTNSPTHQFMRKIDLRTASATWSTSWSTAQTVTCIGIPNKSGNTAGGVTGSPSSAFDRVTWFYSVNGGAETALNLDQPLSISVPAGQTFVVKAYLQPLSQGPWTSPPWIADSTGVNGPLIYADDGVVPPQPSKFNEGFN